MVHRLCCVVERARLQGVSGDHATVPQPLASHMSAAISLCILLDNAILDRPERHCDESNMRVLHLTCGSVVAGDDPSDGPGL